MCTLKTFAGLGILALALLAIQPSEVEAQFRRYSVSYQYNYPGPYYYPSTAYYPAVVPYAYPAYPVYEYRTNSVYALPGYRPVYGGTYYYGGMTPYPYGGVAPYSGVGFYYFRR